MVAIYYISIKFTNLFSTFYNISNQANKSRTNYLIRVVQLVYSSVMISWNKWLLHVGYDVVIVLLFISLQ